MKYHRLVYKSRLTGHIGRTGWFKNRAIPADAAKFLNRQYSYLRHWIESYKTPLTLRANR